MKTCTYGDCKRDLYAKGFCGAHYQRKAAGRDMDAPIRRQRIPKEDRYDENGRRLCVACSEYLDVSEFNSRPGGKDGLTPWCIRCTILCRYNISKAQYREMLASQDGKCAACKGQFGLSERLCIDHDHNCCDRSGSCGKCVRAILCTNCNAVLGMAKDNISVLRGAIRYLEEVDSGGSDREYLAGVA